MWRIAFQDKVTVSLFLLLIFYCLHAMIELIINKSPLIDSLNQPTAALLYLPHHLLFAAPYLQVATISSLFYICSNYTPWGCRDHHIWDCKPSDFLIYPIYFIFSVSLFFDTLHHFSKHLALEGCSAGMETLWRKKNFPLLISPSPLPRIMFIAY